MICRAACLFVFAVLGCVPAFADSYALVTFDEPSTSPSLYATSYANFYGGTVSGSPQLGYSFGATSAGQSEIGFTIYIAPTFPVHEISFDVDYYSGSVSSAYLNVDAEGPGAPVYTQALPGHTFIDLVDPAGINTLYIYDPGYTPDSAASIDNVAFNPSLAPVGTTPEPSTLPLFATGLFSLFGLCWLRNGRNRLAA